MTMQRIASVSILFVWVAAAQEGRPSHTAADRAAIEQLHERDAAAAKKGDVKTLMDLWTVDGVALPPGEQPVKGIDAIRSWLGKDAASTANLEITNYAMDFQEVKLFGDDAVEWARTSVTVKPKGAPFGMRASGNLMRMLRRQPDGTWKVARAIWNMEKPVPETPPAQR
jgi:uncharacterized protein (TIGR02246 family)